MTTPGTATTDCPSRGWNGRMTSPASEVAKSSSTDAGGRSSSTSGRVCRDGHVGFVVGALEYEFEDGGDPLTVNEGRRSASPSEDPVAGRTSRRPTRIFLIDDSTEPESYPTWRSCAAIPRRSGPAPPARLRPNALDVAGQEMRVDESGTCWRPPARGARREARCGLLGVAPSGWRVRCRGVAFSGEVRWLGEPLWRPCRPGRAVAGTC
jgi:hypothetical protein